MDIPDEAIFHTIYDLDDRYQVPGAQYLRRAGRTRMAARFAHWRGIYDDKGRLMVAICHEHGPGRFLGMGRRPQYDEKFSALGLRIPMNYMSTP